MEKNDYFVTIILMLLINFSFLCHVLLPLDILELNTVNLMKQERKSTINRTAQHVQQPAVNPQMHHFSYSQSLLGLVLSAPVQESTGCVICAAKRLTGYSWPPSKTYSTPEQRSTSQLKINSPVPLKWPRGTTCQNPADRYCLCLRSDFYSDQTSFPNWFVDMAGSYTLMSKLHSAAVYAYLTIQCCTIPISYGSEFKNCISYWLDLIERRHIVKYNIFFLLLLSCTIQIM